MDTKVREKDLKGEISNLLMIAGQLGKNLQAIKRVQATGNVSDIKLKANQEVERLIEAQFKQTLDDVENKQQELSLLGQGAFEEERCSQSDINRLDRLEKENQFLKEQLTEWKARYSMQAEELSNSKAVVKSVLTERDELRNTCSQLQTSIQELSKQRKRRNMNLKSALLNENKLSVSEGKVVAMSSFSKIDDFKPEKRVKAGKDEVVVENLETSSVEVENVTEKLFESVSVGGFEGHKCRKIEDVREEQLNEKKIKEQAKEQELKELGQVYINDLENGVQREDIALNIAKEQMMAERAKRRVYS